MSKGESRRGFTCVEGEWTPVCLRMPVPSPSNQSHVSDSASSVSRLVSAPRTTANPFASKWALSPDSPSPWWLLSEVEEEEDDDDGGVNENVASGSTYRGMSRMSGEGADIRRWTCVRAVTARRARQSQAVVS